VQVGAFKNRARADVVASELSGLYQQSVLVAPARVKNQTFYRVRFLAETKPDAKTLATTLRRNDNFLTWIVPLP
jgi:cell division protein FtsN